MDLKSKSVKALLWDFGGMISQRLSGFVISIILARLLTPEEFGLIGISMVFVVILQVFVDLGFSSALIQSNSKSSIAYDTVFYLNVFGGIILTLLFYFFAPFVSRFYQDSNLTAVLRWLSLMVLINSFNQIHKTILNQQLDFKLLTLINLFSSALSGIFAAISAFYGQGVYALVIQNLGYALFSNIFLWRFVNWRPRLKFSFLELKKLSGFSIYVFFDTLTATFFQKLDVIFIGKVFSSITLGFYSRAESLNNQITALTSGSIRKVFFPILSKLKTEKKEFDRTYFKVISLICFLSFLLSGVLFVLAEIIIVGLFGEKWSSSIIIFQILVLKSFNVPLNGMLLNALLSKGKAKENFKIGLFRKTIRTLPIFVGLAYGLIPFVWGVTIISFILTIFNIYFVCKYLEIKLLYHLRKVFEGIVPFFFLVCISYFIDQDSNVISLLMCVTYIIIYLLYAMFIKMEGAELVRSNIYKLYR